MVQNTASNVAYFLSIPVVNAADLGVLRQWENLKIGQDGDLVWVKDFTFSQLGSVAVKSIPSKRVYTAQDGKLFPQNSLLPERNLPTPLWTPIQRAIGLEMPALNHNFFGFAEKITLNIVPSDQEQAAVGMLLPLSVLSKAAADIAAVRLSRLQWVLVGEAQAFVLGSPLLPLQGAVFWQKNNFLIPVGHDFALPVLCAAMDRQINPDGSHWVVWGADGGCFLMEKRAFVALSLGSVRLSVGVK